MGWNAQDIPSLAGKTAIVTGANRGVGFEIARALACSSATVVLACRDAERGEAAIRRIMDTCSDAKARFSLLDLADLRSVHQFAADFSANHERLDILVNNAAIMAPPFSATSDGHELQFGTNHLGHFALTGLLLGLIVTTPRARIVTMTSAGHRFAQIDFDNLDGRKNYDPQRAYAQSKLANLLFTYELRRKLEQTGKDTIATAAHPGWTRTELAVHWPAVQRLNRFIGQSPQMGALPALYAVTAAGVQSGDYYGPGGFAQLRGFPAKVRSSRASYEKDVAARLWTVSESSTGIQYRLR